MDERNRPVVAVVDDDESLRRSLRNLLCSVGFGVGLDLLGHLVIEDSHIPVVILTAHGDEETRRRSLQAGAVAFLDKPFRSDALLDVVRAALR